MLLVAIASLAMAAPAGATCPGFNGKILFDRGGSLFTTSSDGTGEAALAAGAGPRNSAAWSPEGTRIAFDRSNGLWIMQANGTGETALGLARIATQPTWSPDASELAFTSGATPATVHEIWGVQPSGSGDRQIADTGNPNVTVRGPDWSPNGSLVAYSMDDFDNGAFLIDAARSDGSGVIGGLTFTSSGFAYSPPSWSPDGSKFAFELDGNIRVQAADDPNDVQVLTESAAVDTNPVWSPDGARIAFESARDDPNGATCGFSCPNFEVYVMNADGSAESRLTSSAAREKLDDWQSIPANAYARPRGGTPMRISLVTAYAPCISPNRRHGDPLAVGSCTPPVQSSAVATVGTLDANGEPAKSIGLAEMFVKPGNPVTPADEADVRLELRITDVRRKDDLSDYAGELQARPLLRITDKDNTPSPGGPGAATTQDAPFPYTVPCATTSDTTIGSLCSVLTSADAVLPGSAKEERRSNWQLQRFDLHDGGPDGDAETTADNTLFASEGIFVP